VSGVKGTIKSTDEISSLFKTAQKYTTGSLIALIGTTDRERGTGGRVAFVAGKRLGSAPKRNRAKRLLREAARKTDAPWFDMDIVFVAREKTTTTSLSMVVEDMLCVQRKLEKARKNPE
jgi:ribonuclease P protein component